MRNDVPGANLRSGHFRNLLVVTEVARVISYCGHDLLTNTY